MLLETVTDKEAGVLEKSLLVYRYNNDSGIPNYSLKDVKNNISTDNIISYPRYWHGYLTVLKPLLVVTDYDGILLINTIIQILVIIGVLSILTIKKYYKLIIPYILLILSLIPMVIMKSIQYSSVWYIFNIGIIAILLLDKKIEKNFSIACMIFAILGASSSYFDLLTYPLITFGIPAVIYFTIIKNKKLKDLLHLAISWIYAYGVVWGSKWIIATLLTRENVIKDALGAANERTSSISTTAEHFTRMDVLKGNFDSFFNGYVIITLLVFLFILVIKVNKDNIKVLKKQIPLIIIGISPIIWYLVLGNHSYIHSWMTNKILSITYFALLIIISNIISYKKINDN
jgi:hypothetical protein